jgi:hypothetical protein
MNDLFGDQVPVKGKNFRARNQAKARKNDLFETPYSMTEQLLEVEHFGKHVRILEPAAGNGAIEWVLRREGFDVIANDIQIGDDFLMRVHPAEYIITNPPYSLALEFILKAKEVCMDKFAFLMPLDYLHGQERFKRLYHDVEFPLARIWVFTRRPPLESEIRDDGKYPTGTLTFAWFVWDRHHRGPAHIGWIDNQRYVLKAGE